MPSSPALRILTAIGLTLAGAALAAWIVPIEFRAVQEHLRGFPQSDALTQNLRPVVLAAFCFLPAAAATLYALSGALDRYLARQMLGTVGICLLAITMIWILMDVQDNINEFQSAENTPIFLLEYYAVTLPYVFVLVVPFALMLGLLYCLGKLSNSREIIAMIQTGRGVVRVIMPLGAVGLFLSFACLLLNYHWAPWGEGYQKALLEYAKSGSASQARNVLFHHEDSGRTWFVGSFPYEYEKGEPLRNVAITIKGEDGQPAARLKAPVVTWNKITRAWSFEDAVLLDLRAELMPEFITLESPHLILDWTETPYQIVKPGLNARYLGVPELRSWLQENREGEWVNRRTYLTQWHYRWSQPWICLVVVLLAAPLGIVFSRRGAAGGVALAVLLCASMLLSARLTLGLGDAGYLSPVLAAWGTNLIFTAIAMILLYRRLRGRPIYQTIKKLFPVGE